MRVAGRGDETGMTRGRGRGRGRWDRSAAPSSPGGPRPRRGEAGDFAGRRSRRLSVTTGRPPASRAAADGHSVGAGRVRAGHGPLAGISHPRRRPFRTAAPSRAPASSQHSQDAPPRPVSGHAHPPPPTHPPCLYASAGSQRPAGTRNPQRPAGAKRGRTRISDGLFKLFNLDNLFRTTTSLRPPIPPSPSRPPHPSLPIPPSPSRPRRGPGACGTRQARWQ